MIKSKYGFSYDEEAKVWRKSNYILLRHTFVPFVFFSDMLGTSYYSAEKPGHSFHGLYRHSDDYITYDTQYYLDDFSLCEQISLLCRAVAILYWQKMDYWDFQQGGVGKKTPINDVSFDEAFGL